MTTDTSAGGLISAGTSKRALIRRPAPNIADGLVLETPAVPVDADLAFRQWHAYSAALTGAGWQTIEVPEAREYADSVFVEDTVVMVGDVAIITSPGAPSRRGEPDQTAATLRGLGYELRHMSGHGTLDGGDVLKVGSTIYVGRSSRTNAAGLAEFRALSEPLGFTVIGVSVTKVLHLKSMVTALPDSTIIGYPALVDDPGFFPHFRSMPEPGGSHVVDLGDGRLLIAASAPRSADLLADLGYTPVIVDVSEYEKIDGCVTCLSVRLRHDPS